MSSGTLPMFCSHRPRGYPRAINNFALQVLVATFATNKSLVDDVATRAAVTEVLD